MAKKSKNGLLKKTKYTKSGDELYLLIHNPLPSSSSANNFQGIVDWLHRIDPSIQLQCIYHQGTVSIGIRSVCPVIHQPHQHRNIIVELAPNADLSLLLGEHEHSKILTHGALPGAVSCIYEYHFEDHDHPDSKYCDACGQVTPCSPLS